MRIGVSTTARETSALAARGIAGRPAHPGEGRVDAEPAGTGSGGVALRPGRVIAYSWLLAGLPIAALQVAHAGAHERVELPPLAHWLRDTSLAVPVAALALVAASLVIVRFGPNTGGRPSLAAAAALGLAAAAAFAVLAIPLAQAHGALFGAEPETGMTPLQHALTEGIAVFQVALVLVPVVLALGVPWQPARTASVPDIRVAARSTR